MGAEIHPELLDDTFLERLGDFNEDPQRYSVPLQEHITGMREELGERIHGDDKTHIIERSVISDKVFSSAMFEQGLIDQRFYGVYTDRVCRELEKHPIDLVVYLRADPEVSFRRQLGRGREEESNVSIEYLQLLHKHHEIWIPNYVEYFNTGYLEVDYNTFKKPEEIRDAIEERIRETERRRLSRATQLHELLTEGIDIELD